MPAASAQFQWSQVLRAWRICNGAGARGSGLHEDVLGVLDNVAVGKPLLGFFSTKLCEEEVRLWGVPFRVLELKGWV